MNAVVSWLLGASILFLVALAVDAILARRCPLPASALWNAALVAAIALPAAVGWLPLWELPLLPAEQPTPRTAENLEWVKVDHAGQVVAVPPPRIIPRQEAGPHALPVPSRPETAFDPLPGTPTPRWPNWRVDIGATLAVLYTGGLFVLLSQLTVNLWAVRRLRQRAHPVETTVWLARFEHWRRTVAPWRAVTLLKSDDVSVPIVLGWWWPAVVIPAGLMEETAAQPIDAILVHELAHVERADCAWQLVERLVIVFYWFHPLVWLASRRIAAVRERACDDFAIHALADRDVYAATLIEMATRLSNHQRLGLAMAVVRTSKLEQRLAAIEASAGQSRVRLGGIMRGAMTISLLAVIAISFGVRLVRAEAEPAARQKPAPSKPAKPELAPLRSAPGNAAGEVDDLFKDFDDSEQEDDFEFHDSVEDQFPQAQREVAKQLFGFLLKQKYNQAAGLFTPQLREALSGDRLRGLFEELAAPFGTLRSRATLHRGRIGSRELPDLMLTWGRKHFLSMRLLFDERDKISGLWIGKNPLVEDIEQLKLGQVAEGLTVTANGIAFGEPMQELAKANLSLTINLLDEQGQPVEIKNPWDASISFYRELAEDEPSTAKDHWNDTTTGERWRYVENQSRSPNRAERLAPGVYRAFVIRRPGGRYDLTDRIVLDGTQRDTVIDLPKQPAASVNVDLVDQLTGKPVTGADVRITSEDPRLPSYRYGGSEFPEARVELKDLLPGRHKIIAHRRAPGIGQLEYDPAEAHVQLERGKTAELTLKMRGKLLSPEEMARRWPFTLQGQVTDADGRAVAGATIKAYSGVQSLSEMGQTTSDGDGRYVLRFGPGYWPQDGASFGSAVVSVRKEGLFDPDVGARKPFILAGEAEPPLEGRDGRTVLKINTTHDLNFVMLPAVGVSVELIDDVFKPLPNTKFSLETIDSRSDRPILTETTNAKGQAAISGISPREAMRWSLQGTPFPERSNPVLFTGPGKYKTRLQAYVDRTTLSRFFRIEQVLDATGKDVTAEVVQDDPLMREPLSEELQTACRAIVGKLLAANRLWIEPAPRDTWPYQFELHFDAVPNGQKSRATYENTGPDSMNPHATHGMTYASQLAGLADAENVVFRAMEVTPQRVTLAYSFKKPIRVQAGNGVDNFWRGSISAVSREGIVVLDPSRDVPLEVQGDVLHERFEDFRLVEPGQYAPLRIQITLVRHSDLAFDWVFRTYEPDLWMLDESRNPTLPEAPPIMTLDKLRIDGQPARRLDNLNDQRIVEPPRR